MNAFSAGLTAGLLLGMFLGVGVSLFALWWLSSSKKKSTVPAKLPPVPHLALLALLGGVVLSLISDVHITLAQTATMVPLVIPINPVMSSTNDWMATFAPIAAIGIGMTLSLAVFGFLGKTIKSAFS